MENPGLVVYADTFLLSIEKARKLIGYEPEYTLSKGVAEYVAFMREHMPQQRGYSPHSCETYAYSFRLLLAFVARRLESDPIVLLATIRDGYRSALADAGLAEHRLDALGSVSAAE